MYWRNLTLLTKLQKVLALLAELQKVFALPAALRKIQAMPSERGNPSRLLALLPLPAATEGPKSRVVILLMTKMALLFPYTP
jgi:hypothetical protein